MTFDAFLEQYRVPVLRVLNFRVRSLYRSSPINIVTVYVSLCYCVTVLLRLTVPVPVHVPVLVPVHV